MIDPQNVALSVVIPSGRDIPRELLESLLTQATMEDEVIIVNDSAGQTGNWPLKVSSPEPHAGAPEQKTTTGANPTISDSRLQVKHSQGGASVARNVGWKTATNDWVLFLDDDVSVRDRFLDEVRRSIGRNADSDLVGFRVRSPPPETGWERMGEETLTLDRGAERRTTDDTPVRVQDVWMYGAGAAFTISRSLVERMRGFKNEIGAGRPYGGAEDTEFIWHASHHGTISYDGTVSVLHVHPSSHEGWSRKLSNYGQGVGFLGGAIETRDAIEYVVGYCNFIRESLESAAFETLSQHEQSLAEQAIETAVTETIRTFNFSRQSVTMPTACSQSCRSGIE